MFAKFLGEVTSHRRAWPVASFWLIAVTVANVQTGGAWRSTILFAIPVAIVAWRDWPLGFVFAAIAILAARFGGALPEP